MRNSKQAFFSVHNSNTQLSSNPSNSCSVELVKRTFGVYGKAMVDMGECTNEAYFCTLSGGGKGPSCGDYSLTCDGRAVATNY